MIHVHDSPNLDDKDNNTGDGVDSRDHVEIGVDSNKGWLNNYEAEQPIIAAPSRWELLGADLYSFDNVTTIVSSTSSRPIFKGQMFRTKEDFKRELDLHALNERYEYMIRRSTKTQFEATCKEPVCDWVIKAIERKMGTYWIVKKYVRSHNCMVDVFMMHFQKTSSAKIAELMAPKVNWNGRIIRPLYIIENMRGNHGIQVLYTKAWRATKNAKHRVFGKPL
ncbi:hypothetical protein Dsin_024861 [Dipteronia sinensis]|uniref:Transposase MuDR plant domain-containing protein n=1 Tax=Dipteronia sinensis TaxID=43782 RepID=A0AAD9ZVB1_9ROSI|nr:hypothetical protein Dsin_024861 [Dipteronia sinensis]